MYDGMRDTLTASQVGFAEEALRLRAEIKFDFGKTKCESNFESLSSSLSAPPPWLPIRRFVRPFSPIYSFYNVLFSFSPSFSSFILLFLVVSFLCVILDFFLSFFLFLESGSIFLLC